MKTIKQVMDEHCLKVLKACDNNRTKAAKILGISIRSLRNYLNAMKANGVDIEMLDVEERSNQSNFKKIFPTNKERLNYLDNRHPQMKVS